MIIYELCFKCLPLYYNRNIQLELVNGWKNEKDFCIFLRYRARKGFWKIEEMLNLLTEQGLRIEQSERLNLGQMGGMMRAIEGYYERLKELLWMKLTYFYLFHIFNCFSNFFGFEVLGNVLLKECNKINLLDGWRIRKSWVKMIILKIFWWYFIIKKMGM